MDRGSSKHSPRVDDEMAHEVQGTTQGRVGGRAEEWKMAEPSGEDQPRYGETESDAFSRFATYLGRIWPATRDEVAASAAANEAPDEVLRLIDRLPEGRTFENAADAWHTITEEESTR